MGRCSTPDTVLRDRRKKLVMIHLMIFSAYVLCYNVNIITMCIMTILIVVILMLI